jgi:hypothetical protein
MLDLKKGEVKFILDEIIDNKKPRFLPGVSHDIGSLCSCFPAILLDVTC